MAPAVSVVNSGEAAGEPEPKSGPKGVYRKASQICAHEWYILRGINHGTVLWKLGAWTGGHSFWAVCAEKNKEP